MKLQNTKGFTLIELLVVIAIIGILATGATATYTSQLQKARDTTRITDIQALKAAVEQEYQDSSEYPSISPVTAATSTCDSSPSGAGRPIDCLTTMGYMAKLPKDPKSSQGGVSGSPLDYIYTAGQDVNGVKMQKYEISTGFENKGNVSSKAKGDSGDNDNRLEIGVTVVGQGVQTTFNTLRDKNNNKSCSTLNTTDLRIAGPCAE